MSSLKTRTNELNIYSIVSYAEEFPIFNAGKIDGVNIILIIVVIINCVFLKNQLVKVKWKKNLLNI